MENELPVFTKIEDALNSNAPFKLARQMKYNIEKIVEDKWHMIHDALLLNDLIGWEIKSEKDLRFLSGLFRSHKCIKTLIMELRDIKGDPVNLIEFATALGSTHIRELSIRSVPIDSDVSEIYRACESIKALQSLTIFHDIRPQDSEPIARALSNESLERFKIFSNDVAAEFWTPVIPVLSIHKSMKALELWRYGPNGCRALGEILGKNKSIVKVMWSDNPNTLVTLEEMEKVVIGLKVNTTLQKMDLKFLDSGASRAICEALANNQIKLHHLILSYSKLSENSVQTLSESLKTNTCLKLLALVNCSLNDNTIVQLSDGLVLNSTLKNLSIANANLSGSFSMQALCGAIKSHKSLETVRLALEELTDEQCKLIGDMLVHNQRLKGLYFAVNVSDEGVKSICEGMVYNSTLHDLFMDNMTFGVEGMKAVKNMLAMNSSLKQLHINCSTDSEECINLFCEGLKKNTSVRILNINKYGFLNDTPLHAKLKVELEDNYALDQVIMASFSCDQILTRNQRLKSEAKFKVAILSHNIARSDQALTVLPRELWIKILSHVTHPGVGTLDTIARNIFSSYIQ